MDFRNSEGKRVLRKLISDLKEHPFSISRIVNHNLHNAPMWDGDPSVFFPPEPCERTQTEFLESLKETHPYHSMAMDYYNQNSDDKEEEYMLSSILPSRSRIMSFGNLGFLRHMFWEAVPKSSPDKPKIFYARMHEMLEGSFHMPYCGMFSDCVHDTESCHICDLHNAEEFREINKRINDEKAKREKAIHEYRSHCNLMDPVYMDKNKMLHDKESFIKKWPEIFRRKSERETFKTLCTKGPMEASGSGGDGDKRELSIWQELNLRSSAKVNDNQQNAPMWKGDPSDLYTPPEQTLAEYLESLKETHPYHLMAMDYYNQNNDDKEEEYIISSIVANGIMSFGNLGFLRHMFWKAVPKTSPDKPKIFYARMHEMLEGSFHMPYCGMFSDCVHDTESCHICDLHNAEEFREINKRINDEKAKREKAIHEYRSHRNLMDLEYMDKNKMLHQKESFIKKWPEIFLRKRPVEASGSGGDGDNKENEGSSNKKPRNVPTEEDMLVEMEISKRKLLRSQSK